MVCFQSSISLFLNYSVILNISRIYALWNKIIMNCSKLLLTEEEKDLTYLAKFILALVHGSEENHVVQKSEHSVFWPTSSIQ